MKWFEIILLCCYVPLIECVCTSLGILHKIREWKGTENEYIYSMTSDKYSLQPIENEFKIEYSEFIKCEISYQFQSNDIYTVLNLLNKQKQHQQQRQQLHQIGLSRRGRQNLKIKIMKTCQPIDIQMKLAERTRRNWLQMICAMQGLQTCW